MSTKPIFNCRCRNCDSLYNENKSTADWKGYCSQACVHEKSRKHGFKKKNEKYLGMNEYEILNKANLIGSVFVDSNGCVL